MKLCKLSENQVITSIAKCTLTNIIGESGILVTFMMSMQNFNKKMF